MKKRGVMGKKKNQQTKCKTKKKVKPFNNKSHTKATTLSYLEKKNHAMDIHPSIYNSASKSNNCKKQGRSKGYGFERKKAKSPKKRANAVGRFCRLFKVCKKSRATEHEEEYFEDTSDDAKEKKASKSLKLADYIDKLTKNPSGVISRTMSNDVPTGLPKVKRFLSYQGELDDLLLHVSAGTKVSRNNPLPKTPFLLPARLYHSPEHHFSHCPKHLVEELRSLRIAPMENLKEKSSYFAAKKNDMPAPKALKRVFREIRKDLPRGLDIDAYGSMFVRFDEDAPTYMKALLSGGPSSPYADGLFLFDIYCDAKYPAEHCLVKHITKGANTLKLKHSPGGFSPNLHASTGKVCLSLLGTWNGIGWSPNKSNIYQVLSTLLRDIFGVENPYYNEPNYGFWEGTAPTKNHSDAVEYCNAYLREATLRLAILAPLREPIPGYERVIKLHFLVRREAIEVRMKTWLQEAKEKLANALQNAKDTNKKSERIKWLQTHIATMEDLIKSVKGALLKNMNGYTITETVRSYEENVVHIQRCLEKLKSFGSLFDYSKNDSIPLKIERGGFTLGVTNRKKMIDSAIVDGWEKKYSETVKNVERTQIKVKEAKLKVQERRKQIFSKPNIIKSERQEHDEKGGDPSDSVSKDPIDDGDEPLPAGFTTHKKWLQDVLEHSKDCEEYDDDDNIKFGAAPQFKKA